MSRGVGCGSDADQKADAGSAVKGCVRACASAWESSILKIVAKRGMLDAQRNSQVPKTLPPRLSGAAKRLLGLVPADGNFIGNTALQRKSKLGARYWETRKELIDKGFLTRGKGRGGSVAILGAERVTAHKITKKGKLFVRRESDLYEPLRNWLESEWGKAVLEEGDFFDVRVTATAKRRDRSSGKWSRPDVTVVQVNSYDLLPQPVLEVTTFEVKKYSEAENIRSIYEAAAHSRWAHHAYLVAEVPSSDYEFPERFASELERFKISLLLMWKDKHGWSFEETEYETERLSPEPKELNVLLKYFFKDDEKREKEFRKAIGK